GAERETIAKLLEKQLTEINWVVAPKSQPKQLGFFELFSKLMGGGQEEKPDEPVVALLHLDGMIVDGDTDRPDRIVADPIVKAIREIESEKNVRAVVVRINSPGGSASASEAIRRALEKLAAKKPVIVSMG